MKVLTAVVHRFAKAFLAFLEHFRIDIHQVDCQVPIRLFLASIVQYPQRNITRPARNVDTFCDLADFRAARLQGGNKLVLP